MENGWAEWGKHVLKQLEIHHEQLDGIDDKITKLQVEIAMLKVKSGIWGLIGASIPVGVALFYRYLEGK